jgi:hypothetical protein
MPAATLDHEPPRLPQLIKLTTVPGLLRRGTMVLGQLAQHTAMLNQLPRSTTVLGQHAKLAAMFLRRLRSITVPELSHPFQIRQRIRPWLKFC